jgi:hypothetical protein
VVAGWRRSADRTRLRANSLLTGNFTGNFAILRLRSPKPDREMAALQRLFAKFPTQTNRENISGNRELFLSIRELLVRVTSTSAPRSPRGGQPEFSGIARRVRSVPARRSLRAGCGLISEFRHRVGQARKNSISANLFRVASESGHRRMWSVCRKSATTGIDQFVCVYSGMIFVTQ